MKVVVAGSSGLIGTALVAALRRDGHRVARLVRRKPAAPDEFGWDPARAELDQRALRGADAAVNLCGVAIGARRWTGSFKQELRDSRLTPTDVLSGAVAAAGVPLLVNAGGVHVYGGATGDRVIDETARPGSGFLADLCRDWEAATASAADAGVRTVLLRNGLVLARTGGLLGLLRPFFALGVGGRFGDGRQYTPWVSLADEIGAVRHVLTDDRIAGPVNVVGPAPVTNAEFTRALGRALHRPTPLVVPSFVLRTVVGEFADEAVLRGPRAIPAVLEQTGYTFRHPTLGTALADLFAPGGDGA